MIKVRHTLTGSLAAYLPEIIEAAGEVVEVNARELANDIRQAMEDDKSGRLYSRDDGTVYQASAPGEAPAIKEGDLVASIVAVGVSPLVWAVISLDPKAPWLEYGTDQIEPRPAFGPAAERLRPAFLADMARLEDRMRRR